MLKWKKNVYKGWEGMTFEDTFGVGTVAILNWNYHFLVLYIPYFDYSLFLSKRLQARYKCAGSLNSGSVPAGK